MTASIEYKGALRCEATHLQSGSTIETDAPTDNRGKGERFSPTDLLGVSLATCMITTMGIRAGDMGINLEGTRVGMTKHMLSEPRRVGKMEVELILPGTNVSDADRRLLEKIGDTCPVIRSLHPDLQVITSYTWES
jgi:uncharacterized OsmC-like protein